MLISASVRNTGTAGMELDVQDDPKRAQNVEPVSPRQVLTLQLFQMYLIKPIVRQTFFSQASIKVPYIQTSHPLRKSRVLTLLLISINLSNTMPWTRLAFHTKTLSNYYMKPSSLLSSLNNTPVRPWLIYPLVLMKKIWPKTFRMMMTSPMIMEKSIRNLMMRMGKTILVLEVQVALKEEILKIKIQNLTTQQCLLPAHTQSINPQNIIKSQGDLANHNKQTPPP